MTPALTPLEALGRAEALRHGVMWREVVQIGLGLIPLHLPLAYAVVPREAATERLPSVTAGETGGAALLETNGRIVHDRVRPVLRPRSAPRSQKD